MWKQHAYPAARSIAPPPAPSAIPRYERQEGVADHVTCGNSDAVIKTFSGSPDAILLSAETNSAMFTLTDRLNRDTNVFMVGAGHQLVVSLARERVLARNHTAGQNAIVTVVGLWAARREYGDDPRRGES